MKILCISTHPDDETLGCGGTLLRHQANGDALYWLIVTQAYEPQWSAEIIECKTAEIQAVADAYGVQETFRLALPSLRLDAIPQSDLIEGIRNGIDQVRPETVYLIHDGDVHTDHHAVFTATMSVLKAFYMHKWGVRRILCYETLSSTEAAPSQLHRLFLPNVYHDITPYIERKVEIMAMYKSETQRDPLPRGPSAIQALARYRGATVGVDYAEAFMMIREVS